jgi:methylated-DNA-[protein]-cysteine S-methyltransferase
MRDARAYALFDTAVGQCGIAWGSNGIVGVQLPERSERETRARLARRCGETATEMTPPAHVQRAIDDIIALVRGERRDLTHIELDMSDVPQRHRSVYEVARTIPPGETLTYGAIATRLGEPGTARAVGQALGKNPFPIIVPCHRVLAADGTMRGFSAHGGVDTKRRLLMIEGALLQLDL